MTTDHSQCPFCGTRRIPVPNGYVTRSDKTDILWACGTWYHKSTGGLDRSARCNKIANPTTEN